MSISSIAIKSGDRRLGSTYHPVINTEGELNLENLVIHQIRDHDKSIYGKTVEENVEILLKVLAGHIMLVHFACIEKPANLQTTLRDAPDFPIIDTLELCKKRFDKRNNHYSPKRWDWLTCAMPRLKHLLLWRVSSHALNSFVVF